MIKDQDTICAISTPNGIGGISVLRVSGPKALEISSKICKFLPPTPESHRIYFGNASTVATPLQAIDEVLAAFFAKGRSFTGEETIEISCHGNPNICGRLIRELVLAGARTADRGEFTYRAFMNGRIDLVQAESVLSLIESKTDEGSRQALRQLKGELSINLSTIEQDVIWALANIEASIDFSTEGLEIVSTENLLIRLHRALEKVQKLTKSFSSGRALKHGLRVVLFGAPNAGKSSLLNLLCGQDRAIVTPEAGTTRDTIEAQTSHRGYLLNLVDTAGVRTSDQLVEKLGIERALAEAEKADVVLFVEDGIADTQSLDETQLRQLNPLRTICLRNKSDLLSVSEKGKVKTGDFYQRSFLQLDVSALLPEDGDKIKDAILQLAVGQELEDSAVILQSRHFEKLTEAEKYLQQSIAMTKDQMSFDLTAIELKSTLIAIQEVMGTRFDDQIMDRVFKEFCIGK